MNCRPGDLAIVFRTGPKTTSALGRILRVTQRAPDRDDEDPVKRPRWYYAPPVMRNSDGVEVAYVNDCCLKALPGEDVDESLPTSQPTEVTE